MLRYALRCGATLAVLAFVTAIMVGVQYAYLLNYGF